MTEPQKLNSNRENESETARSAESPDQEKSKPETRETADSVSQLREDVEQRIKATAEIKQEDIPEMIYEGMTLAEKYGVQQKLNKAVLYLDNPENPKTFRSMERLRRLWNKVPGPIQWDVVHNLTRNNPGYVFLRFLCKTGILDYKRAEKITDTKSISEGTREALTAIFKIAKIFLDELEGIDEQLVEWIMNGANFTEDMVFNAKLEVEKARRERRKKAGTVNRREAA